MTCPCNNCICVPVCRHKRFNQLMADCSLVNTGYIFFDIDHHARQRRLKNVIDELDPVKWALAAVSHLLEEKLDFLEEKL